MTQKRLISHLRGKPYQLIKQEIKKAIIWAKELDIIDSDEDLRYIPTPNNYLEPIKILGRPSRNSLRYTFTDNYLFVVTLRRKIREHLRNEHN